MKKLVFTCISLVSLLIVLIYFSSCSIVLAKDEIEKLSISNHIPLHSYSYLEKNPKAYVDSPIILPFSSSGLSTDLTSSFSNIVNMQIFTGLNK